MPLLAIRWLDTVTFQLESLYCAFAYAVMAQPREKKTARRRPLSKCEKDHSNLGKNLRLEISKVEGTFPKSFIRVSL